MQKRVCQNDRLVVHVRPESADEITLNEIESKLTLPSLPAMINNQQVRCNHEGHRLMRALWSEITVGIWRSNLHG